jgi:hypothetical protein
MSHEKHDPMKQLVGAPMRRPGDQVQTPTPDVTAVPGPHWDKDGAPKPGNPLLTGTGFLDQHTIDYAQGRSTKSSPVTATPAAPAPTRRKRG